MLVRILGALSLALLVAEARANPGEEQQIVFKPIALMVQGDTEAWGELLENINSLDNSDENQRTLALRARAERLFVDYWTEYLRIRYEAMKTMSGETPYSDYFRRPSGGATAHQVDCRETDYVALIFIAGRSKSARSTSRFGISYRWEHSSVEKLKWRWRGQKRKGTLHGSDAWWIPDPKTGRERQVFTEGLYLNDTTRVNGIWTGIFSHRGSELHRESFELSNCGDVDARETSTTPTS